jgi:uncharacterized protein
MKCPTCTDAVLVMADRQGIEIDYCPQCRGVWLDRGELDKLIERAVPAAAPAQRPAQAQPPSRPDFVDSDYHKKQQYGQQGHYRKKSWLSDIFD